MDADAIQAIVAAYEARLISYDEARRALVETELISDPRDLFAEEA